MKAYASKIKIAFAQSVAEAERLIGRWWDGTYTATRQGLIDAIRAILATRLGAVLRNLWKEGWFLGDESAKSVIARTDVNWGDWEPGDPAAARIIGSGSRLQALLESYGIRTIKSVADTNMDRLAEEIGNAVAEGDSAASLARRLPDILNVSGRADMIARTEVARAVTAATMSRYTQTGISRKEWEVAPDERVCPICRGNEAAGDIPTSQPFPSGVLAPPGHPNCRCAIMPAEVHDVDITDLDTVLSDAVAVKYVQADVIKEPAWMHELRGRHGEWVKSTGGLVDSTDLKMGKDGSVTHRSEGVKLGSVIREPDTPRKGTTTFTVTHADGTQVYKGVYKREALAALAKHHNQAVTFKPEEAAAPEASPAPEPVKKPVLTPDELVQKLNDDPSYVPSDEEHQALDDEYQAVSKRWTEAAFGSNPEGIRRWGDEYFSMQARNDVLYRAVATSSTRRELAAESAAAEAARGKVLDTSAFSGSFDEHLPPSEAAEIKSLIRDSHLAFPDPKGVPWGEHGSPGYERSYRLDTLKYKSAQSMMENAGVPHEAARAIAGWPGMKTSDRYMTSASGGRFPNMLNNVARWASTGDDARAVSTFFDQARTMKKPSISESDFTRHAETRQPTYSGGKPYDVLAWDDQSPEADKRREDAAIYWGVRAQEYYTKQVLASLHKRQQKDSITVTRMIYGDQAQALKNAMAMGQDWQVKTRTLSSWAEPSARAKNTIQKSSEKYITQSVGGKNPVWLTQEAVPAQVFMHWRGEGELRNSVKVLGEVVVADSATDSSKAQAAAV